MALALGCHKKWRSNQANLYRLSYAAMARGWRRQLTGLKTAGFVNPNAGTKKDDFDHWEPLGRFLMPELHARVDEALRERRSNKFAQETTADDGMLQMVLSCPTKLTFGS